jgi:hypothetical protein
LRHGWRDVSVTGDDNGPLQVFSKLLRANLPLLEGKRSPIADLNDGPMARERERGGFIGYWATQDKMIVTMY